MHGEIANTLNGSSAPSHPSRRLVPVGQVPPGEVDEPLEIDVPAAEAAMRDLLAALGMSRHEEIMRHTPRRVVQAYREFFTPREFVPTVFPNHEQYAELVLVRGIRFESVCEHHFLPFVGVAHVGYLPGKEVVGISKLARAVELFARRPQRQERLTIQIVEWLAEHLQPRGIGVVMSAEHTCMTLRGARAGGASTVTSAFRGLLDDDPRYRSDFHLLMGQAG